MEEESTEERGQPEGRPLFVCMIMMPNAIN